MFKKQKGFSTILIIVIVLVVIAGGVLTWQYWPEPTEQEAITEDQGATDQPVVEEVVKDQGATDQPVVEEVVVDWDSLISEVQTVIGPTFLGTRVGERPMIISQTGDITGDGSPEALVYLGQGGAYTMFLTLMRIENGKPVIAHFKQADGTISFIMFLDGASVMNGTGLGMLPDENAIYSAHWSRVVSGEAYGDLSDCTVQAYRWNVQTKVFDFDLELSNEIRLDFCQKADF